MLNHLVVFFLFSFFFLRLGLGQRRAVVIIGRWLLPSLVDTGDICCHYWQHILVRCMASYFITKKCIYNTPDNDSIVLEKCKFVLGKSFNSISEKCGNLVSANLT